MPWWRETSIPCIAPGGGCAATYWRTGASMDEPARPDPSAAAGAAETEATTTVTTAATQAASRIIRRVVVLHLRGSERVPERRGATPPLASWNVRVAAGLLSRSGCTIWV